MTIWKHFKIICVLLLACGGVFGYGFIAETKDLSDSVKGDEVDLSSFVPEKVTKDGLVKVLPVPRERTPRPAPQFDCSDRGFTVTLRQADAANTKINEPMGNLLHLGQLSAACGFSMKTTSTEVLLVFSFNSCYVRKQKDAYVLSLRWYGNDRVLSCPLTKPFPSLVCKTHAMELSVGEGVSDELSILMNGQLTPLLRVATQCWQRRQSDQGGLMFVIPYSSCGVVFRDGRSILDLRSNDDSVTLSCPYTRPSGIPQDLYKNFPSGVKYIPLHRRFNQPVVSLESPYGFTNAPVLQPNWLVKRPSLPAHFNMSVNIPFAVPVPTKPLFTKDPFFLSPDAVPVSMNPFAESALQLSGSPMQLFGRLDQLSEGPRSEVTVFGDTLPPSEDYNRPYRFRDFPAGHKHHGTSGRTFETRDYPFGDGNQPFRIWGPTFRGNTQPFENQDVPVAGSTHSFMKPDIPLGGSAQPSENWDPSAGGSTRPFVNPDGPFGGSARPFENHDYPFRDGDHLLDGLSRGKGKQFEDRDYLSGYSSSRGRERFYGGRLHHYDGSRLRHTDSHFAVGHRNFDGSGSSLGGGRRQFDGSDGLSRGKNHRFGGSHSYSGGEHRRLDSSDHFSGGGRPFDGSDRPFGGGNRRFDGSRSFSRVGHGRLREGDHFSGGEGHRLDGSDRPSRVGIRYLYDGAGISRSGKRRLDGSGKPSGGENHRFDGSDAFSGGGHHSFGDTDRAMAGVRTKPHVRALYPSGFRSDLSEGVNPVSAEGGNAGQVSDSQYGRSEGFEDLSEKGTFEEGPGLKPLNQKLEWISQLLPSGYVISSKATKGPRTLLQSDENELEPVQGLPGDLELNSDVVAKPRALNPEPATLVRDVQLPNSQATSVWFKVIPPSSQ